ncbi:DNA-formamidopyrimidine glycosylase family protein [Actinomycetaceae bacterium MB13-C1-2]|nr:DNA-formamidopyrimidine glycosylase family protein [Actinomycetaceae bacterium MB13-C1-2]
MPEGHSIRRLANTFEEWFVGSQCFTSSPQGRFERGAQLLNGRVMADSESVGKHLFLRFDDLESESTMPLWLHVHLGLYGAWRFHADSGVEVAASIGAPRRNNSYREVREDTGVVPLRRRENEGIAVDRTEAAADGLWQPPEPVGAVRLRIDNGRVAADLAGPTRCEVLTPEEVEGVIDRLGPDPLDHRSDPSALKARFVTNVRARKRPISELIMDQSVIAGVGNIYRAEGLFRQGISPNRKGANVSIPRLERLWDDYVYLLDKGVKEGRIITVRSEDRPDPEIAKDLDPEALRWYVYHRTGRNCLVCGNEISEKEVQGRRLFWCGTCQK